MSTIQVALGDQPARAVPLGTAAREVLPAIAANSQPVLAALVNHEVVSLACPLTVNSRVSALTLADAHGWRVYRWTLSFLLAKAAHETFPESTLRVRHAFGGGLFCTLEPPTTGAATGAAVIAELEVALHRIVALDLPIEPLCVSYEDAIRLFSEAAQADKLNLLQHRNPPQVTLVRCGDFLDLAQEPMAYRTGLLALFALTPYENGFVLRIPHVGHPEALRPFEPQPHLFSIYQEHVAWGRILGVTTVGELNATIQERRVDEFIRTAEALHDKKLARIADQIAARRPDVRLVLIAGPSSAGKTTFAKRLTTHLRVNGLRTMMLSTDDYFVGDARNPRDAQGNLDYEHIESMDLPRLNRDLAALLAGTAVHLPRFDFVARTPRDHETSAQLEPGALLVMEGIHCLNPRLTEIIPGALKFTIYVNALTQLAIDHHNRISTTDNRLLRRLVRDNQFRGHSALPTLRRWPAVQQGEKRWIFPYQHLADATFNSALDYELAVLKPFVTPLLNEIKPAHPEYAEARRLTGFLHNFLAIGPDAVPGDSILREYIGGSQLPY